MQDKNKGRERQTGDKNNTMHTIKKKFKKKILHDVFGVVVHRRVVDPEPLEKC